MSGLEKMLAQIGEEARRSAEEILENAKKEAAAISGEAEKACAEIRKKSEMDCAKVREDVLKKSRSACKMEEKKQVLAQKQELIGEVLKEAEDAFCELPEAEYFPALIRLAAPRLRGQACVMRLNRRDLVRMPEDFQEYLSAEAEKTGGTVTIDRRPIDIDGGFVLVCGMVEENCSASALFSSMRESLTDAVGAFLFAQGERT